MKHNHRFWIGTVCLVLGGLSALAFGADKTSPEREGRGGTPAVDATRGRLPEQVDRLLAAAWAEAKVRPAPPADDAEYVRRVYLDLVGKIPTAAEARDFLDDPSPDKRTKLVEFLLDSPAYLSHATEAYRMLLLPEADTDAQLRGLTPTFEAWLRKKIAEDVGYDQIVKEVLTVRLGSPGRRAGIAQDPAPSLHRWPFTSPRMLSPRTSPPAQREPSWVSGSNVPSATTILSTNGSARSSGACRLLRRRLEARQGRCSRSDPRGGRPPRAGDPRDQADRQSRVPRLQETAVGPSGHRARASWPIG